MPLNIACKYSEIHNLNTQNPSHYNDKKQELQVTHQNSALTNTSYDSRLISSATTSANALSAVPQSQNTTENSGPRWERVDEKSLNKNNQNDQTKNAANLQLNIENSSQNGRSTLQLSEEGGHRGRWEYNCCEDNISHNNKTTTTSNGVGTTTTSNTNASVTGVTLKNKIPPSISGNNNSVNSPQHTMGECSYASSVHSEGNVLGENEHETLSQATTVPIRGEVKMPEGLPETVASGR